MPQHNIPHKSPQSIFLSSDQGVKNETGNTVDFALRQPIRIPNNCQAFISLSSCTFLNVFYNVSETNHILYYELSSGPDLYSYEMQRGNYTITTLLSRLNEDFADSSMVFTYDELTFKIKITGSTFGFRFYDGIHSLLPVLGFSPMTSLNTEYTAPKCVNLSGVPYVDLVCPNLLIDSNGSESGVPSTLARINTGVLLGGVVAYVDQSQHKYRIFQPSVSNIRISFLDTKGNDLDFLGTEWSVVLQIVFIYTPQYIPEIQNFPLPD